MPAPSDHLHVSEIWRYPIKSFGGESLPAATIGEEGIAGDRVWAVVDAESGKVASAKRSKFWGFLLTCGARFLNEGAPEDPASLAIEFPDGTELTADNPAMLTRLSDLAGRTVRLKYATREAKTMEMEWVPESQLGLEKAVEFTASRTQQDEDSDIPVGAVPTGGAGSRYHDLAPLHILTTSSIRALMDGDAPLRLAGRKYRPNLVIGGDHWDASYVEDAWMGSSIDVGELTLWPTTPVSRCVMTTLQHREAPRDRMALRRNAQHHRVKTPFTTAPTPCLGLYTDVTQAGTVRIGDPVTPR